MSKQGYKAGANYSDINRIRGLSEGGYSAEEISDKLRIDLPVIEGHLPEAVEKEKRKRRTKAEMAAAAEDAAKAEE